MAAAIFVVGVIGATMAAMTIAMRLYARERHRTALDGLAGALGGETDRRGCWRGSRAGVWVQLTYVTRGFGSGAEYWTEIDAVLPPGHPLSLHVRHHRWRDRGRIGRGEMTDLEVGSPAFDELFVVEAAPAEIVRRLLDPEVQAYLLAHDRAELDTMLVGERPVLRFAVRGWIEVLDEARGAIDVVARIAARIRTAFAEAAAAKPVRDLGSPYRTVVDDRAARSASEAWLREVAYVDSLRGARDTQSRATWAIVLAAAVAVAVLGVHALFG